MLRIATVIALVALIGGCGDDAAQAPAKEAGAAGPSAAITSADVRLSVTTHRGIDSLSGVRVEGTCTGGPVRVELGHSPPYEPLRQVGDPRIDSITAPERAALTAPCESRRFVIRRRLLSVRVGRGPLRATPSGGDAVDVRIKAFGIE